MATDIRLKEGLPEITEALVATYTECRHINHLGHKPLPSREAIVDILADLMDILYPGLLCAGRTCTSATSSTTSAT